MKKALRVLLVVAIVLIVIIGAAAAYVSWFMPDVGKAPDIKVALTPERIKRGEYLATNVAICVDCHSTRDWSLYAGPLVKGTEGKGGERFGEELGFPGTFNAPNLTPYHLKNWTDGEIFRAITAGVNKDGRALFPVMPYNNYGKLDKEDIYDIIAYIKSLPSVANDVPASAPSFPVNFIINTMPKPAALTTKPSEKDSVAYGKYLVTMAACGDCHTKFEKGSFVKGMEFAGGREFPYPGGVIRSANITPHATGIASWDRERFIRRFKQYTDSSYQSPRLTPQDFNTAMPWMMYAGMKESDLSSIFQYLKTLKPIENVPVKFTPTKATTK